MATVTKEIALNTAKLLTAKKQEAIDKLKSEFEQSVREAYCESIPKDVVNTKAIHPEYFDTSKGIYIHGNGWSHQYVSLSESVIVQRRSTYWQPTNDQSSKLKKVFNKIESLENELRLLIKDIEVSLYSLKTYKRVETEFPEAFELLPTKTTMALAINIDDIRKKL